MRLDNKHSQKHFKAMNSSASRIILFKDTEEMIIDVEQPIASAAAVLPSKRESMASDNSAELPDAMDTSLPTSFEPEMFKSDKDLPECQEVVIEAEDVKVHEVAKEVEVETGESSSQHKKHSHHHHSKVTCFDVERKNSDISEFDGLLQYIKFLFCFSVSGQEEEGQKEKAQT